MCDWTTTIWGRGLTKGQLTSFSVPVSTAAASFYKIKANEQQPFTTIKDIMKTALTSKKIMSALIK